MTDYRLKINWGIDYLLNCIKENGAFIYKIDCDTGVIARQYNILRHAGSLYALCRGIQYTDFEDKNKLLNRSFSYLEKCILPVKGKNNLYCVVEKNEVKLGGAGLALLALVEWYLLEPSEEKLKLMEHLASFIFYMQEESGKFRSKFYYVNNYPSNFESTYYTGEAILALLRYFRITNDQKSLIVASRGIDYMIDNPVLNSEGSHDHNHWLAIALADFYRITQRKDVYDELQSITEATLNSVKSNYNKKTKSYKLSSAGMSTRGETLTAALLLEYDIGRVEKIPLFISALNEITNYCFALQLGAEAHFGNFSLKGGIIKSNKRRHVRIDYVQHFMQVLLEMDHFQNLSQNMGININ
jgi:hypothetical protein